MSFVTLVRAVLLVFGVGAVLAGTVLFPLVRRGIAAWLRLAENMRPGTRTERLGLVGLAANDALLRAWQLLMAAVFLVAWWYLGTPSGAAHLVTPLRLHS